MGQAMEIYFLIVVLGTPLAILLVAVLAGYLHRHDDAQLSSWQLERSSSGQTTSEQLEINQMLDAQNQLRRRRGAPERTLQEVTDELGDESW